MSLLDEFMETGKEVYQVSKREWINIKIEHMKEWYRLANVSNNIEERLYQEELKSSIFHREQVEKALKGGITVSEEVLKDYPGIIEKIEKQKEIERNKPRITQQEINTLKVGDKIKLNNWKLTVYKKDNDNIIARLYKSKTKAIVINAGMEGILSIGWN